MCVCERIAASGVTPSIHKCTNSIRTKTATTTTTSTAAAINNLINNKNNNNNTINNNNKNYNNNINSNLNNNNNNGNANDKKLTNVMDKLDPSIHCFLSPSLFSLYSFSNSLSPSTVVSGSDLEPTASEIAKRIEDFLKLKKIIRSPSDLPVELTKKIASDIIAMSETEPCGLQGCLLYVSLEGEDHKPQTIGSLKLGENTIVPTFVIYLHLRRRYSDWFKFIAAKFLRHLFRDSPYTIHDVYKLYKRKLFRIHL